LPYGVTIDCCDGKRLLDRIQKDLPTRKSRVTSRIHGRNQGTYALRHTTQFCIGAYFMADRPEADGLLPLDAKNLYSPLLLLPSDRVLLISVPACG
jgi:hypothetical protein